MGRLERWNAGDGTGQVLFAQLNFCMVDEGKQN